jgi:hypothetical protein
MKTKSCHKTNLGSFAGRLVADGDGYVCYHDHTRYAKASDEQLEQWAQSMSLSVANAAELELASRALDRWRDGE